MHFFSLIKKINKTLFVYLSMPSLSVPVPPTLFYLPSKINIYFLKLSTDIYFAKIVVLLCEGPSVQSTIQNCSYKNIYSYWFTTIRVFILLPIVNLYLYLYIYAVTSRRSSVLALFVV